MLGASVDGAEWVSDFIDVDEKAWRADLILNAFEEEDTRAILAIAISERLREDKISWAFTKEENYFVKTVYMVGKGCNFDN